MRNPDSLYLELGYCLLVNRDTILYLYNVDET